MFAVGILCVFAMATSLGRRGALFLPRGQIYKSSSTFIKNILILTVAIFLSPGHTSKIKDCNKITFTQVLLVSTFDKVITELQKIQRIQLCYGAHIQIK